MTFKREHLPIPRSFCINPVICISLFVSYTLCQQHTHTLAYTNAVLSVAVTPVSTLVLPGTMVTFQCMVRTNDPMANLQFSWRYPQQLPGAVVVVGNTLTVTAADLSSAGAYICTVNNSRTGAVASANGTLSIGRKKEYIADF